MSIGKKWMVVASVMATGFGTALFFRKDASQASRRQTGLEESTFRQHVERRVADDAAHARVDAATASDTWHMPSVAPAAIAQVPAQNHPTFQKSMSPVAALLAPVESVADEQPADALPLAEEPRWNFNGTDDTLTHLIVDGDTLSKLAARYLGGSDRYLEIFELNRDVLSTADLLPIGVLIKIPRTTARAVEPPGAQPPAEIPESGPVLQLVPVSPRGVDRSEREE
ncbi:MAG TPA: hypothetical protein VHV08_16160 [Pirellulales bacterium]|jgi:nucleoid-associated protein YgaU|nr:hypothetical protein [Pirellulales bacterium]